MKCNHHEETVTHLHISLRLFALQIATMAPSFADLDPETEYGDGEDDIDFSGTLKASACGQGRIYATDNIRIDLREQYEVRMEEGLDTFIVIDGLPKVPPASKEKLVKFLLRKLTTAGRTKEENVFMPMNEAGDMSEGFAFVEYETPAQAAQAVKMLHATPLDKKHTIAVNKLTDIERYGREGRIEEEYHAPEMAPFEEKEHLRWWLGDPQGRDQFVMYRGENVGIYWNENSENPQPVINRENWTESFVQWVSTPTYLPSCVCLLIIRIVS
jgi:translation initiation factor 3 subunit B